MMTDSYSRFISEAFIGPIRSVLMVDDDYPTFDDILGAQQAENDGHQARTNKAWRSNPRGLMRIIDKFRRHSPPLLVDIHDGQNLGPESEHSVAQHLHQSDLLILDYQLDKARPGDGGRAIQVLRHLMRNDHFNLVVIYTNEKLDIVFENILLGLLAPCYQHGFDLCDEIVDIVETTEDSYPEVLEHLRGSVIVSQYLHSRRSLNEYLRAVCKGEGGYTQFLDICDRAKIPAKHRRKLLLYCLAEFERSELSIMNTNDSDNSFVWSTNSVKWLKADSIFVAFSEKSADDDLLDQLQIALSDWNPNPSRLFLAKIRAEIDDHGAVAQTQALAHRYALASWYFGLMESSDSERRSRIAESVSRHSDHLMDLVLPRVENFANRLIAADAACGDIEERCHHHFKVDPSNDQEWKQAALEHNALVCSGRPTGWHLTTGHIFLVAEEHWLCLSAACDMVPGQLPKWREQTLGERLPFIAVKLHPHKMPDDIHSNRYIFLQMDDGVNVFCFNDPCSEDSRPHWDLFFADRAGRFDPDGFGFSMWRTESEPQGEADSGDENPQLALVKLEAEVIRQLRYQYALNLIQKLGVSLTRVGLDFSDGLRAE